MKIFALGPGLYESEDGRVKIFHDHTFQTECDEPHPVRLRVDQLNQDAWVARLRSRLGAKSHLKRLKSGEVAEYLTWYCEGNEEHSYSMWTVQVDEDWTDDVYEKFDGALGAAELAVGEKITVSRRSR